MSTRHQLKRTIASVLRTVVGRRNLIRSGRYLLNAGRFDDGNDMNWNGELRLASELIQQARGARRDFTVIDVGANIGQYSESILRLASGLGINDVRLLAVEACAATHSHLCVRLASHNGSGRVVALRCAVSSSCGKAQFNVIEADAGRNSLLPVDGDITTKETVDVTTIDQLLIDQKLDKVHLLKIDTEGHDFAVLEGARHALQDERLGVVQFEYNWRWIEQGAYLRDVFRLIEKMNYRLGKVTPAGIEVFDSWRPQLETLVENNYALVRRDVLENLTTIELASQW